jgi:hypothetical protein
LKKEVPLPAAIAAIAAAVLLAALAIYWGMSRLGGDPAEIERIIQRGVVGGGVKMPSEAGQGAPAASGAPPPGVMPRSATTAPIPPMGQPPR